MEIGELAVPVLDNQALALGIINGALPACDLAALGNYFGRAPSAAQAS